MGGARLRRRRQLLAAGMIAALAGCVAAALVLIDRNASHLPYAEPSYLMFVLLLSVALVSTAVLLGSFAPRLAVPAITGTLIGTLPELAFPVILKSPMAPEWATPEFNRLTWLVLTMQAPGAWILEALGITYLGLWFEGLTNPPVSYILVHRSLLVFLNVVFYASCLCLVQWALYRWRQRSTQPRA